jgi:hypothetical protein
MSLPVLSLLGPTAAGYFIAANCFGPQYASGGMVVGLVVGTFLGFKVLRS